MATSKTSAVLKRPPSMWRKGYRLPPRKSPDARKSQRGRENERRAGRSCSSEDAAQGHRQAQITLALPLFREKVRAPAQRLVFWLAYLKDDGRFTVARLRRICTGLALFQRLYVFPRGRHLCRDIAIQFGCVVVQAHPTQVYSLPRGECKQFPVAGPHILVGITAP